MSMSAEHWFRFFPTGVTASGPQELRFSPDFTPTPKEYDEQLLPCHPDFQAWIPSLETTLRQEYPTLPERYLDKSNDQSLLVQYGVYVYRICSALYRAAEIQDQANHGTDMKSRFEAGESIAAILQEEVESQLADLDGEQDSAENQKELLLDLTTSLLSIETLDFRIFVCARVVERVLHFRFDWLSGSARERAERNIASLIDHGEKGEKIREEDEAAVTLGEQMTEVLETLPLDLLLNLYDSPDGELSTRVNLLLH